jgi:RHS repeat-associated protein
LQAISYNVFKSPVEITEEGKDKLSFVYNDDNSRSVMFYGSLDADKNLRPNRKYYSADGSMEIKQNIHTGAIEFITYLGGDGYTAPVAYRQVHDATTPPSGAGGLLYLHRDYQGSILAITNDAGAVLEKRQFDAWGAIISVQDGNGNILNGLTILDRGYTGHEHLQSVGLINMNGRIYDPKLHRFLQPDNFVQDPSNTQNYNRYGYCYNNPLKYTDVTGEWLQRLLL